MGLFFGVWQCLTDTSTHFAIAALSWLFIENVLPKKKQNMTAVFSCGLIASSIDVDHFFTARSFWLQVIAFNIARFCFYQFIMCYAFLWTKNIGSYITTNETSSPLYNHNSSSVPATLFHFVDEETFKTIPTVLDDFGGWHNTPLEGRIQKRHLVLPIQFNTPISLHCLPGWINPATPHNGLHYEAKQFSSISPKIQNCNFKCSINATVIFFFKFRYLNNYFVSQLTFYCD